MEAGGCGVQAELALAMLCFCDSEAADDALR